MITLPEQPWRRVAAIMALFLAVGPALGVLAGGLSLALVAVIGGSVGAGEALATFVPASFLFSANGALLTYGLGLVPALVCGGVIAWHEGWRGPVTGFSAFLLGVGVGALYYMISEFIGLQNAVYGAIFSVVVCLVPTYLLSRIARLWGRNDPKALPASKVAA